MKTLKILSVSSILALSVLSNKEVAAANMCPAKLFPLTDSTSVHKNDQGRAEIYDFYDHCLGVLSKINAEARIAVDEWKHGRRHEGVKRIKDALKTSVGRLYLDQTDIPPYTAQTLVAAYNISRVLEASVAQNISRKYVSIQVEFMTLTKLVELANWSYQYVDAPYYNEVVDSYLDDSFFKADFPMEYFRNVKDLSAKFISILDQINGALADNTTELDVTYAFVRSISGLIDSSVYRRQFCNAKVKADGIMNIISRFRCGDISVPSKRKVDLIRSEVLELQRVIEGTHVGRRGC